MQVASARVAEGTGAFVPDAGGARWIARGRLTFGNAVSALEASRALALPASGEIDCGELAPVDSAAVAVLLAIKRRGIEEGRSIVFSGIGGSLHTLADLYGVEELLANASAAA
jgi:phospholipid transport system transporter-binding protein